MEKDQVSQNPYWLTVRLSPKEVQQLKKLLTQSAHCRNLSELIRTMLFKKKLTIKKRNASLDELKSEIVKVKGELRSIGVNINQVTHYFNGHPDPAEKRYFARKILPLYKKVGQKTEQLMVMISQLSRL
ncbi:plasmid mobilization protein [Echinicola vietnamensis]|uniref:Bacterial mobilization protein (MobC) n=1 Tax=Echinicola vietnamensis (strain DSM 17526 / LMG 23754 / KMM 6221) TaxID=926556 RepID=L0FYW2_ECHVK|nr:plasmid mobilization relaxosome protein MobC [Echinicola vietnamensis]AGA78233.1 Bacterial mobilization protein (MobC) [Echinicola vietnamensis DSM 17526]